MGKRKQLEEVIVSDRGMMHYVISRGMLDSATFKQLADTGRGYETNDEAILEMHLQAFYRQESPSFNAGLQRLDDAMQRKSVIMTFTPWGD